MTQQKEKLFTEFQAPTRQEWLDKIEVDLKGADFQKRLVWRTNEGFNLQPFYRREDVLKLKTPDALPGEFPFVRGNKKDDKAWYVRQDIVAKAAAEANAKALDILNKGVDSLGFMIPDPRRLLREAGLRQGEGGGLHQLGPHEEDGDEGQGRSAHPFTCSPAC